MAMEMSGITVLGVGNILLRDEGVGVHTVNALREDYAFRPEIDIIDGGTTGTDLLPYFEEADKLIIVDAVNFNKEPGAIGTIENEEVLVHLNTKISSHHIGLKDVLSHVKLLDIEPEELFFIGVQPEIIEPGLELGDKIAGKVDDVLEIILQKLEEWQVESFLKTEKIQS